MDIKALELSDVIGKISEVKPKKSGTKDDAKLSVSFKVSLNLPSMDILPYFHPCLNQFLFDEDAIRFKDGFSSIKWRKNMLNMQIQLSFWDLIADLTGFTLTPIIDTREEDSGLKKRIEVCFKANVKHLDDGNTISLLCEMINSELSMSIFPALVVAEPSTPENKDAFQK